MPKSYKTPTGEPKTGGTFFFRQKTGFRGNKKTLVQIHFGYAWFGCLSEEITSLVGCEQLNGMADPGENLDQFLGI